jgi:DNA-binding response OmpR family regulator
MRVLLVEDNPQLSTWLTKALVQSHFAVYCLGPGPEPRPKRQLAKRRARRPACTLQPV